MTCSLCLRIARLITISGSAELRRGGFLRCDLFLILCRCEDLVYLGYGSNYADMSAATRLVVCDLLMRQEHEVCSLWRWRWLSRGRRKGFKWPSLPFEICRVPLQQIFIHFLTFSDLQGMWWKRLNYHGNHSHHRRKPGEKRHQD